MRIGLSFGLVALVVAPGPLAGRPRAQQILQQIGETYKSVSEYELVANATATGTGKKINMHFAFKAPNRYRMEGAFPGLSEEFGAVIAVHDGSDLWLYFPEKNQYASVAGSKLTTDAPGDLGELSPEVMNAFITSRYRNAAEFTESTLLREETIDFAGKKVACYVLTISQKRGGFAYTWWVDKQRHRIVREDNPASSTVFSVVRLGEPLEDALFKFDLSPGAQKLNLEQ